MPWTEESAQRRLNMMAKFSLEDRLTSLQRRADYMKDGRLDLSVTNLYLRMVSVQDNIFQKLGRAISKQLGR